MPTESVFLKACRGEPVPYTPIWLMRQAGRYMQEYRSVREKVGFLKLCKTPELACEVTVTAAKKIGADAAIIFADILLILEPLGFDLTFDDGKGPQIHNPFRATSDLERIREPQLPESLSFVYDAIRLCRKELPAEIPVIGFAGAPFTVAAYAIEGGSSRNFEKTKALMRSEPEVWHTFLERISSAIGHYLKGQIQAGAQAVQLFDSWVGCLSPNDYEQYVFPHVKRIFESLPSSVPSIHFGVGTGMLLETMKKAGGSVMGVDFQTPLSYAKEILGNISLQGNLDPTVLLSNTAVIEREAKKVLDEAKGSSGHIFNLGHGILPTTPVENVQRLIDFVHTSTQA